MEGKPRIKSDAMLESELAVEVYLPMLMSIVREESVPFWTGAARV
jgi:hypothetical protein